MDIGREGQGPGELNQVFSIALHPDGKLLVRSDGNGRMNVFSLDGEFLDDWPLPGGYMTSLPMVVMTDGTIYTRLPVHESGDGRLREHGMVPFEIDGSEAGAPVFQPRNEALLTFREITATLSSGSRITTTMAVPFSPTTPSALSPFGAMIVGVGNRYRFEVQRFDGTTLIVERVAEPIAVSPNEAEWHRRFTIARARDNQPSWSWSGPDIPASKPYFNGFYADQSGRIWVRRPGPGRRLPDCDENPSPGPIRSIARCWEDTEIIDVLAADGRFLGDVDLPEGTQLRSDRSFVRDDLVLLRFEDEAGTIMVKRYRLVLPGGQ
jgi:hypothetical protein